MLVGFEKNTRVDDWKALDPVSTVLLEPIISVKMVETHCAALTVFTPERTARDATNDAEGVCTLREGTTTV